VSRFSKHVVTVFLTLLAVASAACFYFSLYVTRAMTELANGFGGPQRPYPPISWDQWFLAAICLFGLLAIVVHMKRQKLGRSLALLVFGASLAYTMSMATLPAAWLEATFRTQLDRWAAVATAAVLAAALAWTVSQHPTNDSRGAKAGS
jgi:hypothetical protein